MTMETWGQGADQVWAFVPAQPRPASAPVVGFLHGWGGTEPVAYQAWIDHLVRRGAVVVFPRYQAGLLDRPSAMTAASAAALHGAIERMGAGSLPRFDGRLALVGHSLGGTIAANLAAEAPRFRLPAVRALTVVEPGDSRKEGGPGRAFASIFGDFASIPSGTLMQVVVGADDTNVGSDVGRRIFLGATRVSLADKDFVTIQSDSHGAPGLVADHFAPLAPARTTAVSAASGEVPPERRGARGAWRERRGQPQSAEASGRSPLGGLAARRGETDALDFFGFWKLADALIAAAFDGRDRDAALGGGRAQTFMGTWSDGTPVRALVVTDTP
ncbi:MAG: alpha/beta hydrolase [Vicinamibacteria bacterium]|nr:alpha/beta hydrolase [Vicinamibacteria bacterium]